MEAVVAQTSDSFQTQVLVDALSTRVGGGITDLLNLLPALVRECPQLRLSIVLSTQYQTEIIGGMLPEISVERVDIPPMPSVKRLQFLRSKMPEIVKRRQARVLLCMGELVPRAPGCAMVALVRNLNYFAPWGSLGSFRRELGGSFVRITGKPFIGRLVTRADHLIFVSKASQDDVCRLYPGVRSKSSVAHLGYDPDFCTQPEDVWHQAPTGRYVLSVSALAPHKNQETLIEAFAKLVTHPGFEDLSLVIVGTLMLRRLHKKLVNLSRRLGVDSQVLFTDRLPHSSLPEFYRRSLIHVLPSTLETFGHPYVEAMACGTPVIASDIPVAHEICGNAAEYFPTTDVARLESLMRAVIDDEVKRSEMADRGRTRARDFSWSRTASAVGAQLLKAADQG
jgi:glycosyltransferase involved in cell wall biosynthesis